MKTTLVTICGETDHPLFDKFCHYYTPLVDQVVIQLGVTKNWLSANGQTSGHQVFNEKVEQQNEALRYVHSDTDYILTFDIDEFISKDDLKHIGIILERDRPDCVELQCNNFWHEQGYIGRGGDGWAYESWNPRIWRYVPGMTFTNHRPPTPNYPVNMVCKLPQKFNHYSYVYMNQVYRKLKYYNLIYPQFDYMKWFQDVWMPWNPMSRVAIEWKNSVHPSCKGATTELFTGKHEIKWI
jgi:hypothetical protein